MLDWRPEGYGFEPHRRHCVVSLSKNINPSLVLVQPRKTRPFITERLLMGRKESNKTNKTRCSTAWGKFKRLLPILTSKHVSLRTRGKVFNACVRSALLPGIETWAPTAPDLQRLRRNDRSMVCWICGVGDDEEVSADMHSAMLGVQEVTAALPTRRLRWYGHVARSSSCINSITSMTIPKKKRETKKDLV